MIARTASRRACRAPATPGSAAPDRRHVAFLDDDAAATPDWLERLAAAYATRGRGRRRLARPGLGEPAGPRWFPREFDWVVGCTYRGMPTGARRVRNAIGANMSFRREALEAVGGFQSGRRARRGRPLGCEETELSSGSASRAGRQGRYEPAARVRHLVPAGRATFEYFFKRCRAEGRSKARVTASSGRATASSSERTYVTRTLPLGVLHGLRDAVRGDAGGLGEPPRSRAGCSSRPPGTCTGCSRVGGRRERRAARPSW